MFIAKDETIQCTHFRYIFYTVVMLYRNGFGNFNNVCHYTYEVYIIPLFNHSTQTATLSNNHEIMLPYYINNEQQFTNNFFR